MQWRFKPKRNFCKVLRNRQELWEVPEGEEDPCSLEPKYTAV